MHASAAMETRRIKKPKQEIGVEYLHPVTNNDNALELGVRRFHRTKTEWGFDQFLPLDTFNDASNGYLHDDCCVFGAEVFVIHQSSKGECLATVRHPVHNTYSWKVNKFSAIDKDRLTSQVFRVGQHNWY
ncbi:hypothetical protein C3L33_21005, partial [Rhododendron williamsianum]